MEDLCPWHFKFISSLACCPGAVAAVDFHHLRPVLGKDELQIDCLRRRDPCDPFPHKGFCMFLLRNRSSLAATPFSLECYMKHGAHLIDLPLFNLQRASTHINSQHKNTLKETHTRSTTCIAKHWQLPDSCSPWHATSCRYHVPTRWGCQRIPASRTCPASRCDAR